MKNQQKGFAPIVLVIIVVAVLVLGAGTVVYYQKQKSALKPSDTTAPQQQTTQPIATDKSDEKVYRNEKYGFTFSYPTDWKLKEVYDRTKEGVTYPSSLKNVIDSYVEVSKDGYALRFEINNQGWSRATSVVAKDYKPLVFKDGLRAWRTKNPELSEEGDIPFFQLGTLTPYTGSLKQYYDSNFSSIITHNGNLSFSIYYGFPKNVDAKNYDTNIVGVMDKIAESFSLTTAPVTTTNKESLVTILGNLSYGFPNQDQTKLTNGYYSEKVEECGNQSCSGTYYYVHKKLNEKIITGDLNGDGTADAVVLIDSGQTTPPSSNPKDENVEYTAQAIAAVVNQGGVYKNIAYLGSFDLEYDLGARTVVIKNIEVKNKLIYLTVLKNEGAQSLIWPQEVEIIQLALNSSSSNGFKILKDGASDINSYVAPQVTSVSISGTGNNRKINVSGKDFSLLKNTLILIPQTGGQDFRSVSTLESGQNNSYITAELSSVDFFVSLGGNADTPPFDIKYIPTGKYNVVVSSYRCPERQSCLDVKSNSFSVDIP